MSYRKAEEILPIEIIKLIQRYVDGENIYIPRKENQRKEWGNKTQIRRELEERNTCIFSDFSNGKSVKDLSVKYFLSEKSIQRILRKMK
jgi:Mor family transcriptional regulator